MADGDNSTLDAFLKKRASGRFERFLTESPGSLLGDGWKDADLGAERMRGSGHGTGADHTQPKFKFQLYRRSDFAKPPVTRWAVESLFLDHLEDYWPYLHGDPSFDCRNLMSALPKLPPTEIDVDLLVRLIEFAVNDRWGKGQEPRPAPLVANRVDCREYMEQIFPEQSRRSPLARNPALSATS